MSLTPSQKKHLATLVEHVNRYGSHPTRDELGEAVYGRRKGTGPSVTRALNTLADLGYVTVHEPVQNTEGSTTYSPTDAGREAAATLGAMGEES